MLIMAWITLNGMEILRDNVHHLTVTQCSAAEGWKHTAVCTRYFEILYSDENTTRDLVQYCRGLEIFCISPV